MHQRLLGSYCERIFKRWMLVFFCPCGLAGSGGGGGLFLDFNGRVGAFRQPFAHIGIPKNVFYALLENGVRLVS